MKKYILSAIGGAIIMLIALILIANISAANKQENKEYEHIDYVSAITQDECFVCGNSTKDPVSLHWGEDNVGIVNLNTFEMMRLEINRYGDHGELIEEPAGYMSSSGLIDKEADTYAHAYCFPDNAYASVQITGVQYAIDRDSVQNRLCQNCLNSINDLWFTDQPLAEYAVICFEDRTIQPLLNAHPWFAAGNFGIDCEFKENGAIDLLIHYCPNRYE
ncbi:MAG: hypothetical protein IJZ39_04930 [Oscillospiraceae bacterium]|nr:hypothetical protein [Oscillospiraceae bacterium]